MLMISHMNFSLKLIIRALLVNWKIKLVFYHWSSSFTQLQVGSTSTMYKNSPPVIGMFKFLSLASSLYLFWLLASQKVPTLWKQDVNWTYIRRSEDVQDVWKTSYACSIYVLCPGGAYSIMGIYYDPHNLETTELTISTFPRPLSSLKSYTAILKFPLLIPDKRNIFRD